MYGSMCTIWIPVRRMDPWAPCGSMGAIWIHVHHVYPCGTYGSMSTIWNWRSSGRVADWPIGRWADGPLG